MRERHKYQGIFVYIHRKNPILLNSLYEAYLAYQTFQFSFRSSFLVIR